MKKKFVLLIVGAAILSGYIFVNVNYFYNPLTFKKDHITYLEWDWYKKPLVLEYSVLADEGWKVYKIKDPNEIKFVFDQLKKSPLSYDGDFKSSEIIKELVIRGNDEGIVLIVRQKEDQTFQVKNNTPNLYIDLTEDLMELTDKRFNQALNMD